MLLLLSITQLKLLQFASCNLQGSFQLEEFPQSILVIAENVIMLQVHSYQFG